MQPDMKSNEHAGECEYNISRREARDDKRQGGSKKIERQGVNEDS